MLIKKKLSVDLGPVLNLGKIVTCYPLAILSLLVHLQLPLSDLQLDRSELQSILLQELSNLHALSKGRDV